MASRGQRGRKNRKYPSPFRFSDVVSDNISMVPVERVVREWGGTVVMWGEPAVGEVVVNGHNLKLSRLQATLARGREQGMRLYIGAIFYTLHSMYHRYLAADPTLQQACIRDITGEPILTPWLQDHTFRGVRMYWNCTNNPRSRAFYDACIRAAMEAGYDGIAIEEPRGSAVAVHAGGCFCDHCVNGFRVYLEAKYTAAELAGRGIPSSAGFDYRTIGAGGRAYPRGVRRGVPPQRAAAGRGLPRLPDQGGGRPGQGIARAGARPGEAGGVVLRAAAVVDLRQAERRRGRGQDVDRAHLRLRSSLRRAPLRVGVPAYEGGVVGRPPGPQRHRVVHAPLPGADRRLPAVLPVVQRHAELFDGYQAVEQVGVRYSKPAVRAGHHQVHEACWELLNANVPYGIAASGDDWLARRLAAADAARFELVVVPEPALLDGEQQRVVDAWKAGRAVAWQGVADVLARLEPLVTLASDCKVWLRPRANPANAAVPVVIHLLNTDYDLSQDAMNRQTGVTVRLGHALFGGGRCGGSPCYRPRANRSHCRSRAGGRELRDRPRSARLGPAEAGMRLTGLTKEKNA